MTKCKYCEYQHENGRKLAGHQSWCKYNPNRNRTIEKLRITGSKQKHSELTKQKISKSRIKYLLEHPDMVPYKLNHKHKQSYPEKYFKIILKGFIYQYRVPGTLYEIDFANIDKKIAIEIDGDQHYFDKKIIEHDKLRTAKLKELGWTIIRIRWSDYKKLTVEERKIIVLDIMKYSEDINKKIIHYIEFKKSKDKKIKDKKIKLINDEKIKLINDKKQIILNSKINFSKFGWVKEVSILLGIIENKGGIFVRKYMPKFYEEKCFKRYKIKK